MARGGVTWCSDYSRLNGCGRRWYKDAMRVIGELGRKGVPRAIPAEELQRTLGSSPMFCSWNVSNSKVSDLTTGWPFLFSHPLLGTNKKTAH
jgi:hypothetical protein